MLVYCGCNAKRGKNFHYTESQSQSVNTAAEATARLPQQSVVEPFMGSFLNVTVQLLYWQLLTCVTAYILIEGAHNVSSIEAAVCGPIELNCLTLTGNPPMLSIQFISLISEVSVIQEDLTAAHSLQKGPKVESTPYNIRVYKCWLCVQKKKNLLCCTCVRDAAGKQAQLLIDK